MKNPTQMKNLEPELSKTQRPQPLPFQETKVARLCETAQVMTAMDSIDTMLSRIYKPEPPTLLLHKLEATVSSSYSVIHYLLYRLNFGSLPESNLESIFHRRSRLLVTRLLVTRLLVARLIYLIHSCPHNFSIFVTLLTYLQKHEAKGKKAERGDRHRRGEGGGGDAAGAHGEQQAACTAQQQQGIRRRQRDAKQRAGKRGPHELL
jgi:hypothetical protein